MPETAKALTDPTVSEISCPLGCRMTLMVSGSSNAKPATRYEE